MHGGIGINLEEDNHKIPKHRCDSSILFCRAHGDVEENRFARIFLQKILYRVAQVFRRDVVSVVDEIFDIFSERGVGFGDFA